MVGARTRDLLALIPCETASPSQSDHKTQVVWKGREGLLYYSSTFPLLRVSHDRALGPYAYSANSKVGENYYAQRKKIRGRRN
jgi:hypothetical protein